MENIYDVDEYYKGLNRTRMRFRWPDLPKGSSKSCDVIVKLNEPYHKNNIRLLWPIDGASLDSITKGRPLWTVYCPNRNVVAMFVTRYDARNFVEKVLGYEHVETYMRSD